MTDQRTEKIYDVIIVGAGSSGSTLGYLLTERDLETIHGIRSYTQILLLSLKKSNSRL